MESVEVQTRISVTTSEDDECCSWKTPLQQTEDESVVTELSSPVQAGKQESSNETVSR